MGDTFIKQDQNTGLLARIFRIDVRSLAFFRMALALLILTDSIRRLSDLTVFYTDAGAYPRSLFLVSNSPWVISLHLASGTLAWQIFLVILAIIFALMLFFGYRARLASIISFILLLSLQARNPIILQGGDILLRLLLFWSMFLPLGIYYSFDRAQVLGRSASRFIYSAGSAALLLQIAFVYWFSVGHKLLDPAWVQGDAIFRALRIVHMQQGIGYTLLWFPSALPILTYGVLIFEILGPTLLFLPICSQKVRLAVIGGFLLLHAGFTATLAVGIFPWVAAVAMIPFFPPYFWDFIKSRIKKRNDTKIKIYYDSECGFCKKSVVVLKEFLLLSDAEILPAVKNKSITRLMIEKNSWVVESEDGALHTAYNGFLALVQASPLFQFTASFFRLYLVSAAGERIYAYIASHRVRACMPETDFIARTHVFPSLSRAASVVAIALLIFIAYWNIKNLYSDQRQSDIVADGIGLRQKWNMFTQLAAGETQSWSVALGTFKNGTFENLLTGEKAPYQENLLAKAPYYKNDRWRKFMEQIKPDGRQEYQNGMAQYFCRQEKNKAGDKVIAVDLYRVFGKIDSVGNVIRQGESKFLHHEC